MSKFMPISGYCEGIYLTEPKELLSPDRSLQ